MSNLLTEWVIRILKQGDGAAAAAVELTKVDEAAKKVQVDLAKVDDAATEAAQGMRKVDVAAKETTDTLAKVDKGAAKTASTYADLRTALQALVGAAIVHEMMQFGRASVAAFQESEQAIAKLNGTLRATGQYTPEFSAEMQELSSQLQSVTTQGDEAILGVQTLLISFGAARSDIPKLTEAVLDLSAGLGTDLTSAAMMVGKALQGETSTLGRLGIQISDTASESEKLDQVLMQIEQRFGGLARGEAATMTGQLKVMQNQVGDLMEQVGELIVVALVPWGKAIATVLGEWQRLQAGMKVPFNALTGAQRENVTELHDKSRAAIEKEIDLQERLGKVSRKRADEMRTEIAAAFRRPEVRVGEDPETGLDVYGPGPTVNPAAEAAALSQARATLNPANRPVPVETVTPPRVEPPKVIEERIKATQSLADLEAKMTVDRLDGFAREEAVAAANFNARAAQIIELTRLGRVSAEEKARMEQLNTEVLQADIAAVEVRRRMDAEREADQERRRMARETSETLTVFERELTTEMATASGGRVAIAEREYQRRIAFYGQLLDAGRITEEQILELTRSAEQQRTEVMAQERAKVREEFEQLTLSETERMQLEYDRRIELLREYYDAEIRMAEGNADRIAQLEEDKTAHIKKLTDDRDVAAIDGKLKQLGLSIEEVAQVAASTGTSAFMSWVEGTKNAEEAFRSFASNFLKQIGEMIVQAALLNAFRGIFGGASKLFFGGGGASMGIGNQAGEVNIGSMVAAAGGTFPRLMAAGGVEGVGEVSGPTFFPRFNVLAGEAGREMLTVLAKPQTISVGGVKAVIGNAGPNRLAIIDAANLMAAAPRPVGLAAGGLMLDGGTSGDPGGSILPTASQGQGGRGSIDIRVDLSPDLVARITRNSVEASVAKVTVEMGRSGALAAATRALNS